MGHLEEGGACRGLRCSAELQLKADLLLMLLPMPVASPIDLTAWAGETMRSDFAVAGRSPLPPHQRRGEAIWQIWGVGCCGPRVNNTSLEKALWGHFSTGGHGRMACTREG